ncbi:hypothetical protein J5N97_019594 [Dioscorea zingiberensis]|uniref:DUF4283 domain-containing protein n=1 Tax=Dioscorea zingiberensis TaxID=325984 RepID=A0A9D5CG98_9LILI|nr:hypothetical protein J5N97_019594 [Dioscorea zingiberensis]
MPQDGDLSALWRSWSQGSGLHWRSPENGTTPKHNPTTKQPMPQSAKAPPHQPTLKEQRITGEGAPKHAPPTAKSSTTQPTIVNTKKTDVETGKTEHHFISLAHDSGMEAGLERMRSYTIARVKEIRGGLVDHRHVEALLRTRVDEQWEWSARILQDDRYLIKCPSAEKARQIEKAGPMESPPFTLEFTPWTTDLYRPAKAEGALRWVLIRNLPMFCWGLDTAARMLKPVGDLVRIGGRGCGCEATEDLRVLLGIRKPRRLPSTIHCSLRTLQHEYVIEMEPGQLPLPWDPRRPARQEHTSPPDGKTPQEQANNALHPPANFPADKVDKGKAPLVDLQPTLTSSGGRRPRDIIIREQGEPRQEHQPPHRPACTPPSDERRPAVHLPAATVHDAVTARATS